MRAKRSGESFVEERHKRPVLLNLMEEGECAFPFLSQSCRAHKKACLEGPCKDNAEHMCACLTRRSVKKIDEAIKDRNNFARACCDDELQGFVEM